MRNALAYLGLMGIIILTVSCTKQSTSHYDMLTIPPEGQYSGAPTGTITMILSHPEHPRDSTLLLTLSNSTAESIELPLRKGDDCYWDDFWFYIKTEMGWRPMMAGLDTRCDYSPPGELIPSGLEKVLDLGGIASVYGLGRIVGPASFLLRVNYKDPAGQEFFLYSDEFSLGTPSPIEAFSVTVENAASNTLEWRITNHANQSIWLAPLCSSFSPTGSIDEERSALQRLTAAGSWSNPPAVCKLTSTAIEISRGATLMIDGRQWLKDAGLSPQPGQYRWDLMVFPTPQIDSMEGRHVFSPIFSIPN